MVDMTKSVLVVGFNTRPLARSLKNAGYSVYAVDFFGDQDLAPCVKDSFILTKELRINYDSIKASYSKLLSDFTIKMLRKYSGINNLIIGSGLDNTIEDRILILDEIKERKYTIKNLNNDIKTIENARDIEQIYKYLKFHRFNVPITILYENIKFYNSELQFPIIFKKFRSAGGMNVFKINNFKELSNLDSKFEQKEYNQRDWVIQEYIEGVPISCTTISNGKKCEVVSINRQIIGEEFLNSPRSFTYCGNIVPIDLPRKAEKLIKEISIFLNNELGLKGINGFDYVLKDNYPYLMEINPRIPGSIRATEVSFGLHLLDLHVKSFDLSKWESIRKTIKNKKLKGFSTKLIMFAPKEIDKGLISQINDLESVHDKSESSRNILEGEPLCTILYLGKTLQESYDGAVNVVNKISKIIE
ncbi:MAG: ATP-grasp domain-containing protein [Promethearchaeota archaeon]|jgi:predicted ATP-grasp superfamily ATP-dependent carboligase